VRAESVTLSRVKSRAEELVQSLSNSHSGHSLERLQRFHAPRRGEALFALRSEILGEMAAALGRAETRVNASLARLAKMEREIDELAPSSDRVEFAKRVNAFNAEREIAERRLWELTVQREALGLRRHDVLGKFYPIPARRRVAKD
jgi:hypothetical protein